MHHKNNPSDTTRILDKHTNNVHVCTYTVCLSNILVVSEGLFSWCINYSCCIWWNVLNMHKIYLLYLMEYCRQSPSFLHISRNWMVHTKCYVFCTCSLWSFILSLSVECWTGPFPGSPLKIDIFCSINGHPKQYILVDTIFNYIFHFGLPGTYIKKVDKTTGRRVAGLGEIQYKYIPGGPKYKM